MNNIDEVTRDMDIPENCELRDDFMSCTRNLYSIFEKSVAILLFLAVIFIELTVVNETMNNSTDVDYQFLWGTITILSVVLLLPSLWFMLYALSAKEYIQLDSRGFHLEYRSIFGKGSVKNISLCAIQQFHVSEYHSGCLVELLLFCFLTWIILILKLISGHVISRYYVEIISSGKPYHFYKLTNVDPLQSWIVASGNYVLQNLLMEANTTEEEDCDENVSSNSSNMYYFANEGIYSLPSSEEFDLADKFPALNVPGYIVWNIVKDFNHIQFFRRNQYSRNWFNALRIMRNWFVILVLLPCCTVIPVLLLSEELASEKMLYDFLIGCVVFILSSILGSLFYSFLLIPVGFLFSFIFTRFTTVSWTFSAGKAKLKRTLFGIPFLFRTFDYSDLKFVEIRQRFFLGTTDGNCDVVFKNGTKKELFRMKNIERCDAYWMISQLTQNRFLR